MALGSKNIAIEVLAQSTDSSPPCFPQEPSQVLLHLSGIISFLKLQQGGIHLLLHISEILINVKFCFFHPLKLLYFQEYSFSKKGSIFPPIPLFQTPLT